MAKKRLDVLLCERGMMESRQKAQAVIMAGQVYVAGQKVDKAGAQTEETAEIEVRGKTLAYVSRGGLKLEKAAPEQDAIRESRQQQQQISRQIASFYQEPKDNPRVSDLERQVKELNEKLERKGQDPLELMEKSYEMAARYFPGQAGGQVKSIQSGGPSGNPAAIAAGRATESVVSSLAAPPAPDTIPRNYGFATAVGAGQPAGTNTIRACVAEDQTVTTGA